MPIHCAVVGGGIIGTWTALHLARKGVKTTLIEFEFDESTPNRCSSLGKSRVFSMLGDEHPAKLKYSFQQWRQLEIESNEHNAAGTDHHLELLKTTGLINFGLADNSTGLCADGYLKKHTAILDAASHPTEWLTPAEVARRWPAIRYPKDWGATYDPQGTVLWAAECVRAVRERFVALGGTVLQAKVEWIARLPGRSGEIELVVRLPSGTRQLLGFTKVVLACGPWSSELIPELRPFLKTQVIPVTYWRDRTGEHDMAADFPVIFNSRLTNIYGLPASAHDYPGHCKVLWHGGPEASPDDVEVNLTPIVHKVSKYVKEHLPGLDHGDGQPARLEQCMYTVTPDSRPILDLLTRNIAVGCGFSGSGFKHAPASGLILASLVLGEKSQIPSEFLLPRYSASRFLNNPKL